VVHSSWDRCCGIVGFRPLRPLHATGQRQYIWLDHRTTSVSPSPNAASAFASCGLSLYTPLIFSCKDARAASVMQCAVVVSLAQRYHLRSHQRGTPLVMMVRVQPRSFTSRGWTRFYLQNCFIRSRGATHINSHSRASCLMFACYLLLVV